MNRIDAVHPRLRGELIQHLVGQFSIRGSSPLTRGTLFTSLRRHAPYRFIPAYAGNSLSGFLIHLSCPVHPRLRGELPFAAALVLCVAGSSPLTRGTLQSQRFPYDRRRFIPAYAGNSGNS